MVGAVVCYYISRLFSRSVVEKLAGQGSLALTDRFFNRYDKHAILIARLIPVISFDVVSYAAGPDDHRTLGVRPSYRDWTVARYGGVLFSWART